MVGREVKFMRKSSSLARGRVIACCAGFIVATVLLASCTHTRVATDYSHRVNFANCHTYSWVKVKAANDLWAQRIRRDVNAQLLSKGWVEMPAGGQAAITAFGATRQIPTLETFYDSFGRGFGGWYWGGWGAYGFGQGEGVSTTQTVYTPAGTLVVDIFNAQSKHLIWRGVARRALSGNAQENKDHLAHAVAKMFKNFPPPAPQEQG
jgi:hypothetical protein